MQIEFLKIKRFRNLQNFEISLDKKETISVIIGQNASGKSNFIEAVVLIFKYLDFDFKKPVDLELANGFQLDYSCRNNHIQIHYLPEEKKKWRTIVNYKAVSQDHFIKGKDSYLPRYILAYYSGLGNSNRLEEHFEDHKERFARAVVNAVTNELPEYPRLQYAELIHSQFSLFSFFIDDDPKLTNFLKENLFIEEMQSTLLPMKEPEWAKSSSFKDDIFWGSKGIVRDLIDYLYENVAIAPIKDTIHNSSTLWKKEKKRFEVVYLYFSNFNKIKEFVKTMNWSSFDFFHILNTANVSRLFFQEGIKIRVKKRYADKISFKELSEGEQQLLTVLGLMRFTAGEETLFLLDEPDTHLNPYWRWKYLEFINQIVFDVESEDHKILDTSQVIMSSHDPLTIGSLKKEAVRIFKTDPITGDVKGSMPFEDPKGMGVAGILTEIFKLQTTLDVLTQEQLDERRSLESKKLNEIDLTDEEKNRLTQLNASLDNLGFSRFNRDPLYQKFQAAFEKELKDPKQNYAPLPPEEEKQQRQHIEKLLKQILDDEGIN
ncbi:AAA ATPase domain-containing protein [Mucilaginibacter pineti]|uniref:AAA ATPase domain-containing protein n=1 Tax=Mucilaginibacter pineti TaxID=1391627 RepID=A0A1G7NIX9_9SPHI|nr:AAA family ATPase [Mucilaginibacter pineti]SDF73857.1 AAA ATPase domain-containing protein [Mucilaginibacter pineti]